jgi:hypothetical protein
MAPPTSNEQIIHVLTNNVESTYDLYDCKMFLTNFTKPCRRNPYFRIFFTSILCSDIYAGADVDYEAFGDPWIDTINMRIVNNIVEFGFLDDTNMLWFPYRKNKTFPKDGSGCTHSDPDDEEPPEYDEIDRYNDLIDYIMNMF